MASGTQSAGQTQSANRIGDYVLRRWLAQGGMAELYLGRPLDPVDRRVVVIKKILPQFAEDLQFTRMFAREVQVASVLHHPNIVEVFDAGGIGAHDCYLAMEYVHGTDLSRVLSILRARDQPLPLRHALTIAIDMCAGLHHAHESTDATGAPLGIIHRDVSPSNVLLGFSGEVKVADFGVAKALALTSFTQAGTRKGKLSYMAPEQARADTIDRRADVFALGTVLYEMTTMRRLFSGDNELAIMHQLLFRERPRPSDVIEDFPPILEEIILRAVAHQPEHRHATALELSDELQAFARAWKIPPSRPALGSFLRQIVDAPPHPAEDTRFFDASDPHPVTPANESTAIDGPSTREDSVRSATAPGMASIARVSAALGLPPIAGTLGSPPAFVRGATQPGGWGPPGAGPNAPGTIPASGAEAPSRSRMLPLLAVAGGIAALVVGAGLGSFFLWGRSDDAPPPDAVSDEQAGLRPNDEPTQDDPEAKTSATVEPGQDPEPSAPPSPAAATPEDATELEARSKASQDDVPSARDGARSKRRGGGRRRRGGQRRTSEPTKADPPTKEPAKGSKRPPPPPPPGKKPKTSPTDTLLPIVE